MTHLVKRPTTKNDQKFQEFVNHLDRTTANQGMRALAAKYGFPVTEIEGTLYTSSGWVQMLLDYSSDSGFRDLLRCHHIQASSLYDFDPPKNPTIKIRRDLGLSQNDRKSKLFDFALLLKAARFSKTPAAREIMDYVFGQERWARLEQAAQRETGLSMTQLRAQQRRVEGCPVRPVLVEGLAVAVFTLPERGDVLCASAYERIVGQRAGTVRDWRRYDDELWEGYDTVSGRELQAMKATGWIPMSASHMAVISVQACDRLRDKAGRMGRLLADAIRRMLAGGAPAALPGGR